MEGGKEQREGKPSCAASETCSDADGGTGSPIAATLTAELAAQSESKVFEVCSHPPGLYDELSPLSLSTSKTAASMLAVTSNPPQGARGSSHSAGSFRATRQRSTTRAQDTAAVLEETLSLFVEATGKNEASMRHQLMSKRPERVEEKQRFHTKKKEAWEFFRRLPSFKPKEQEEFEEEFKQKVMTGHSSGT